MACIVAKAQRDRDLAQNNLLDQKCFPPAPGVVNPAAEDTAKACAQTKADVAETLPNTSSAQRNEIRTHEGRNGV